MGIDMNYLMHGGPGSGRTPIKKGGAKNGESKYFIPGTSIRTESGKDHRAELENEEGNGLGREDPQAKRLREALEAHAAAKAKKKAEERAKVEEQKKESPEEIAGRKRTQEEYDRRLKAKAERDQAETDEAKGKARQETEKGEQEAGKATQEKEKGKQEAIRTEEMDATRKIDRAQKKAEADQAKGKAAQEKEKGKQEAEKVRQEASKADLQAELSKQQALKTKAAQDDYRLDRRKKRAETDEAESKAKIQEYLAEKNKLSTARDVETTAASGRKLLNDVGSDAKKLIGANAEKKRVKEAYGLDLSNYSTKELNDMTARLNAEAAYRSARISDEGERTRAAKASADALTGIAGLAVSAVGAYYFIKKLKGD